MTNDTRKTTNGLPETPPADLMADFFQADANEAPQDKPDDLTGELTAIAQACIDDLASPPQPDKGIMLGDALPDPDEPDKGVIMSD